MNTVSITIDGYTLQVDSEKSILSASLEADIYIPHLCHHPDLPDIGACRLCVVEIEGCDEIKTACTTKVEDGMIIHTKTEKLNAMRRLSMELMLANHVDDCTTCPKYLKCELQSLIQYLGVSTSRLRRTLNSVPVNASNPLIVRDLNRCISCGRCVRMCKEVRGVNVLNYEITEDDRIMVDIRKHNSLKEENCRFCGACVEVCPTGALQDKEGVFKENLNRELNLIPCKAECPANIDVPKYIRYIREGKYQDAIAVIREKAPFPHSLGYVCMAFCESACRRKEINKALSIRELKRFAAEHDEGLWRDKVTFKPKTNKKIAVVGSGPAGLTAAYYLAKCGHEVTVFEKSPVAGGMMSTGIPEYRLPRKAVQDEIAEIERAGVIILTNTEITSLENLKTKGFDKILLAIGTGKGVRLPIPGANYKNVYENIEFLQSVSLKRPLTVGEKVVVLGGGNVAFDCARVAKRLGAKDITMACLENRESMTASDDEIQQGSEEGIKILNSRTFVSIEGSCNIAAGVKCQEVASFSFDENKRLKLEIAPDSEHIIPADTVIFATGQRAEIPEKWNIPTGRGNSIITEDGMKISDSDMYAVGDAVYGTNSVIRAIAAGRKVASAIDIELGGDGVIEDKLTEDIVPNSYIGKDENFLSIERAKNECEDVQSRIKNFKEVNHCLNETSACKESNRCLQCDLRTQIRKPKLWAQYKVK
ncbi:FAD-dependent oxidoreductase [Clostridium autoethanogenum]|uniref:FAD-dependent oxidoreductase n=2 Tax=Clostridium autoethanogenum TaxID=84023 RepID=A0A3M0SJB5_9CLOT|nr:FAD-dependent oxidoreductase [Clostridium autoethanogenum]AGY77168.1 FAD-dependent oxidoreductase [Clostridium autoethanogenum DSM 10061]ALU37309.1 Pyridine nucleotide-disulfide oxidoreductase [Clostridium autoethanogenum DSM 10061]OVY50123.1 NAD-dependent dihydropyrimidine dehydrogenase subunit PreT [Clostridium autoethanogenum]RMC98379.1 FAD-dependent oxidoreductase [Clostridium autoethanogenum]